MTMVLNLDLDIVKMYVRTDNQGFPKVYHSGIDARIVLEQINSAKINYL